MNRYFTLCPIPGNYRCPCCWRLVEIPWAFCSDACRVIWLAVECDQVPAYPPQSVGLPVYGRMAA